SAVCSSPLAFGEPALGRFDIRGVEIANLRHGERLAHGRHPLFPSLLADQGNPFDFRAMRRGELDVIPKSVHIPTVKIMEPGQDSNFSMLSRGRINGGDELLVILVMKLA